MKAVAVISVLVMPGGALVVIIYGWHKNRKKKGQAKEEKEKDKEDKEKN